MRAELHALESPGARALVAADWRTEFDTLGLLDPARWAALLRTSPILETSLPGSSAASHSASTPLAKASSGPAGRAIVRTHSLGDGREWVLRPFHHGGWLGGLLGQRLSSPARLFAELKATAVLVRRGAPVAPAAFAVAHRQGASWTGGVATMRLASTGNAAEWLAGEPSEQERSAGLHALGRAIRAFHDHGGRHADLHLGNLVLRTGDAPRAFVVDLDQVAIGAPPSPQRRARELARLDRSVHKRIEDRAAAAAAMAELRDAYAAGDRAIALALDAFRTRGGAERQLTLLRARYAWGARRKNAARSALERTTSTDPLDPAPPTRTGR